MKLVRCAKSGYIISSVMFILAGAFMAFFPALSLKIWGYILGGTVLFSGIIRLIGYFSDDLYSLAFQFDLALGILTVITGVLLILHPQWPEGALGIFVGFFTLVNGLFSLQIAVDSKKFGLKFWWLIMAFSIAVSVFGIFVTVNPFSGMKMLTRLLGFAAMLTGGEKMFLAFYTIVTGKKTQR